MKIIQFTLLIALGLSMGCAGGKSKGVQGVEAAENADDSEVEEDAGLGEYGDTEGGDYTDYGGEVDTNYGVDFGSIYQCDGKCGKSDIDLKAVGSQTMTIKLNKADGTVTAGKAVKFKATPEEREHTFALFILNAPEGIAESQTTGRYIRVEPEGFDADGSVSITIVARDLSYCYRKADGDSYEEEECQDLEDYNSKFDKKFSKTITVSNDVADEIGKVEDEAERAKKAQCMAGALGAGVAVIGGNIGGIGAAAPCLL